MPLSIRLGAVCLLALFLAGCRAHAGTVPSGKPILDGGFWQMDAGLLSRFTDEQFEAEVGHMRRLGMDIIIIQYSNRPYWAPGQEDQVVYFPNSVFEVEPAYQGRETFDALFRAAEREGVKIYLGGLLIEPPREVNYAEKLANWTSEEAYQFRREAVEHFSQYSSFAGYYIPNEPNFGRMRAGGADPALLLDATIEVSNFLRDLKPDMTIIHSIGLYLETREDGSVALASREYLDEQWRPWFAALDSVDVWMIIDGVGTQLSNLEHTDMAQEWARGLCLEFGKSYWTDVENAHMGHDANGNYVASSFTMEELAASLEVAAKHAEKIVTFDYVHYMSRQSHKIDARRLHRDYEEYVAPYLANSTGDAWKLE